MQLAAGREGPAPRHWQANEEAEAGRGLEVRLQRSGPLFVASARRQRLSPQEVPDVGGGAAGV